MITPNSLPRLFIMELEKRVPKAVFSVILCDPLSITIPASFNGIGDLIVCVDEDEITVSIGCHFHTHYEVYTENASTLKGREQAAAEKAAQFVRDVLDDRVRFRGQYAHGRCLNISSWYPEKTEGFRRFSGADEIKDYVWSGAVDET